jgi:hypothetical protein
MEARHGIVIPSGARILVPAVKVAVKIRCIKSRRIDIAQGRIVGVTVPVVLIPYGVLGGESPGLGLIPAGIEVVRAFSP